MSTVLRPCSLQLSRLTLAASLAGALLLPSRAFAQVTFQTVATTATGSAYSSFTSGPSLSANGNLTFSGTLASGTKAIFKSVNGNPVTTAATSASGLFTSFGTPVINNSGTIAFIATTSSGIGTYYLPSTAGGVLALSKTIAGSVSINVAGDVAFSNVASAGVRAFIYKSTAGGAPVLVDSTETVHYSFQFNYLSAPAISGNGSVYYGGSVENDLYAGVYRDGAQDTSSGVESGNRDQFRNVAVNANGNIAYFAPAQVSTSAGYYGSPPYPATGIYVDDVNHPIALLSTYGGQYTSLGAVAINAQKEVAFYGTLGSSMSGIFVGSSSAIKASYKLITTGDALDGSTVTALTFLRDGLADEIGTSAQVAFQATLADGRTGIYTANVARSVFTAAVAAPEPSALALLAPALPLVGVIRRKKRPSNRFLPV